MNRIVVVGASEGGVHAVRELVKRLPRDFSAPLLVVVHIGANQSLLPSILNDLGAPRAQHARHGEALREGRIYVAPSDHHLLVVGHRLELSRGPRENWTRPAIDPLFRSAAESFGPAVVGVILTGQLNDGASGLYEIKRRGGVAIIQEPDEAEAPSMPRGALAAVAVDFRCRLADIPNLLVRLENEPIGPRQALGGHPMAQKEKEPFAAPPAQTCPECGGAMYEETQGKLTRFRCHIGHVMTAEVLATSQLEMLDRDFGVLLRTLNERLGLCRDLAARSAAQNDRAAEARWLAAAEQAAERERAVRAQAEADWLRPETAEGGKTVERASA